MESAISRLSELTTLNDEETQRIISVIERDFQLRAKENKRIEELKEIIRKEKQRSEYMAISKESNNEHCVRCFNRFRTFFNPKESCAKCQFFVCHSCSTYTEETKQWTCRICLKLKELECLTGDWFYDKMGKKYKRCGSAKVVRELHKREKDIVFNKGSTNTISTLMDDHDCDDDLGYGTLTKRVSSHEKVDNGVFLGPYNIRDEKVRNDLNDYAKRLAALIDNLKSDLSKRNTYNRHLSIRQSYRDSLNSRQKQILSDITRTRTLLTDSVQRQNIKLNEACENDIKRLMIHQTEEVLQTSLQGFQETLIAPTSPSSPTCFDAKLAQVIFDTYVNKETSAKSVDGENSPPDVVEPPKTIERQSTTPFFVKSVASELNRNVSSPPVLNQPFEKELRANSFRRVNLLRSKSFDEEDNRKNGDDHHPINSTSRQTSEEKVDLQDDKYRFIGTDVETIKKSRQRVNDWRTSFGMMEPESNLSDVDEADEDRAAWL